MKVFAFVCMFSTLLVFSCSRNEGGESSDKADGTKTQDQKSSETKGLVKVDRESQEKAGIRVQAIKPRSVQEDFVAAGQIVMNEESTAHVGTYTAGRVTELHANVGDFVRQGKILARMHSHDVHETIAAYETALQDVRRQKAAVEYQGRMRDRMLRLLELKSASRQEVDKAESDVRSAQTDLANAEISVQKEVAHLADILHLPESSLQNINETTEQVPAVAPISGIVVNRMITLGSVVEPGQEVYTVTNLSSLWMIASVNESDIAKVHAGQKARVVTQAFPDEAFAGEVTHLGTELDPKTRTLQARILVPNKSSKLRPGMYASAEIIQGKSRNALFVPEEAIQDLNGGSIVFVRKGEDTFEPRVVSIASRLHGEAEVASGLVPGDVVAVKGSFVVKSEMLKSQIGE